MAIDGKKRECIILAAVKCFSRFGFKKASVDEIAKDAGVAKGTVYLAAESKEDLLYQALLHELREWNGTVSRILDPRKPAGELLAALAVHGIESLNQRPLVKQLFEGDLHELLPRWASRFDELTSLGRRNVVEVLQLGVKKGEFRDDLDAEATAELLMDLQVATMLFHNRPSPDLEERRARRLSAAMSLVLNGLVAPEKPSPVKAAGKSHLHV